MTISGYYLGCPGWGVKSWVGRLFPEGTKPAAFLSRYAQVFNSVEGNTTFYALPNPDTVKRWADDVPDEFRYAFHAMLRERVDVGELPPWPTTPQQLGLF